MAQDCPRPSPGIPGDGRAPEAGDLLHSGPEGDYYIDRGSGLVFRHPLPGADGYSERSRADRGVVGQRLESLGATRLAWIRQFAPGAHSLLEVGCAEGDLLLQARAGGLRVAGMEPSGPALAEACRRIPDGDLVRGFFPADAPDRWRDLDVIAAFLVLEHVPSPAGFLAAAAARLAPGGTLVVEVPDLSRYDRADVGALCDDHLFHFDPVSLGVLAGGAGLAIVGQAPGAIPYSTVFAMRAGVRDRVAPRPEQAAAAFRAYLVRRRHWLDRCRARIDSALAAHGRVGAYGLGEAWRLLVAAGVVPTGRFHVALDDRKDWDGREVAPGLRCALPEQAVRELDCVMIFSSVYLESMRRRVDELATAAGRPMAVVDGIGEES
ncbi:MAG: methyltransferase domain-containing protein [Rhodocyclaceae bacterium]|nr:methyltransferase domain-containing protein [Rhodocyclaceae bacterium]